MMIFRILCGEWIEPLWDCMRAEQATGAESCFFIFLPALVMGNFMVLNLFLALLLNSFNSEELKNRKEVMVWSCLMLFVHFCDLFVNLWI